MPEAGGRGGGDVFAPQTDEFKRQARNARRAARRARRRDAKGLKKPNTKPLETKQVVDPRLKARIARDPSEIAEGKAERLAKREDDAFNKAVRQEARRIRRERALSRGEDLGAVGFISRGAQRDDPSNQRFIQEQEDAEREQRRAVEQDTLRFIDWYREEFPDDPAADRVMSNLSKLPMASRAKLIERFPNLPVDVLAVLRAEQRLFSEETEAAELQAAEERRRQEESLAENLLLKGLRGLEFFQREFAGKSGGYRGLYGAYIGGKFQAPEGQSELQPVWDALQVSQKERIADRLGIQHEDLARESESRRVFRIIEEQAEEEREKVRDPDREPGFFERVRRTVGLASTTTFGGGSISLQGTATPTLSTVFGVVTDDAETQRAVSRATGVDIFLDSGIGQILTDPLTFLPSGLFRAPFKIAGPRAAQRFLARPGATAAIRRVARKVVDVANDPRAVKRVLRGADDDVIEQAITAAARGAERGGVGDASLEVAEVLTQNLGKKYTPDITRRALAGRVGGRAGSLAGPSQGRVAAGQALRRAAFPAASEVAGAGLRTARQNLGLPEEGVQRLTGRALREEITVIPEFAQARNLSSAMATARAAVREVSALGAKAPKESRDIVDLLSPGARDTLLEQSRGVKNLLAGTGQKATAAKLRSKAQDILSLRGADLAAAKKRAGVGSKDKLFRELLPPAQRKSGLAKGETWRLRLLQHADDTERKGIVAELTKKADPAQQRLIASIEATTGKDFKDLAVQDMTLSELRAVRDAIEKAVGDEVYISVIRSLRVPVAARGLAKVARAMDSILSTHPPTIVNVERAWARANAVGDWAEVMHIGKARTGEFTSRAFNLGPSAAPEMSKVVDDLIREAGAVAGLNSAQQNLLLRAYKETVQEALRKAGTGHGIYDPMGRGRARVAAQHANKVLLPQPSDIKRTIKAIKKSGLEGLSKEGLKPPPGVVKFLRSVHSNWKFVIITASAMVGGTAGAVGGAAAGTAGAVATLPSALLRRKGLTAPESIGKYIKQHLAGGVAKGSAIGAEVGSTIGGFRYIARVVIGEETVRAVAAQGFGRAAVSRIPFGMGQKLLLKNLPEELRPMAERLLRENVRDVTQEGIGFLQHARFKEAAESRTRDISLIRRGEPEYVERLWWVLNYQVRDSDPVVRELMVDMFSGDKRRKAAQHRVNDWLMGKAPLAGRTAEEGAEFLDNFIRNEAKAFKGLSREKAAARVTDMAQGFLDDTITHRAIWSERLQGEVSKETIKRLAAADLTPRVVHGVRSQWAAPKTLGDIKRIAGKAVLNNPTNALSRKAFLDAEFIERARMYLDAGIEPETALSKAMSEAVDETNTIMFNLERESRFAKGIDLIAPFQQPREEIIRVYAKLLARDPVNIIKLERAASGVWNEGRENGTFVKNSFGQWTLKVPGSAALSGLLGGSGLPIYVPLENLAFIAGGPLKYAVFPSPGGILTFWGVAPKLLFDAKPEWFVSMPKWIREMVFPFGANGTVTNSSLRHIAMSFFGANSPLEFARREDQQETIDRMGVRFLKSAYYTFVTENGREPTDHELDRLAEDAKQSVAAWIRTKAVFDALSPGVGNLVLPGEDDWAAAIEEFRRADGSLDVTAMLAKYPEMAAFVTTDGKYEGPEEFWRQPGLPSKANDFAEAAYRKYEDQFSVEEFAGAMKESRAISRAFDQYDAITSSPLYRESPMLARDKFLRDHPEMRDMFLTTGIRDQEFVAIMSMSDSAMREQELRKWRFEHKVSVKVEQQLRFKFLANGLGVNPFGAARNTFDIADGFTGFRGTPQQYANTLSAAEALKFWNWYRWDAARRLGNNVTWDAVDEQLNLAGAAIAKLRAEHPELSKWESNLIDGPLRRTRERQIYRALGLKGLNVDKLFDDYYTKIPALYNRAFAIKEKMNEAAEAKQWSVYYALRDKRSQIYDTIRVYKNELYLRFPDLNLLQREFEAGIWDAEFTAQNITELQAQGIGWLAVVPEEREYHRLNTQAKRLMVEDLRNMVVEGQVKWEWLTQFQQDLLIGRYGIDRARAWAQGIGVADRSGGGGTGGELGWAYAQFEKYSKRPDGAVAPASYDEYLKIPPDNRAARIAFLRAHPEVREWIASGPMANMPPLIRNMVANIMIQHGKWDGTEMSIEAVTEISWAQLQLEKYNGRPEGALPPRTLDIWMNMPTGAAKAEYLRTHPELQRWFSSGPMANMPDDVRDIVRDIMVNYGLWGESQDPLGKLISRFYELPPDARDAFLKRHPELVEYWRALRPPEERHMFDLAQRYFALQDPMARRFFLESHPELKEYFVNERERRYERFLNRVAFYLGSNPEMVQVYLAEQTRTLKLLLQRYGERPLTVENVVTRTRTGPRRPQAA